MKNKYLSPDIVLTCMQLCGQVLAIESNTETIDPGTGDDIIW